MKKRVTIKDVALKSGYSIATVSKALNGIDVVKPDTKKAIQKVAEEMNYTPNLMGKQLKQGKTKMIGIYTNRIGGHYFNSLIDGVISVLQENGYGVNILVSENREQIISHLLGNVVDGAIIIEEVLEKKDIENIKERDIPVVFINKIVFSHRVGCVVFDSFDKGFLVGNYLVKEGHRQIVYLSGQKEIYDNTQRYSGLVHALSLAAIQITENEVIEGNFIETDSYENTKKFLIEHSNNLPTAIVAANDESAIGAMKAMKEMGYRIPEDISIVGFDDISLLEYIRPKLTTVKNSPIDQGNQAANLLVSMLNEKSVGEIIEIKGKLVLRESVKKIGV